MRILTRYILKEIFSHSLLGLLVFTFVVYVRPLGQLLELAVRHDLSPSGMLVLFFLPSQQRNALGRDGFLYGGAPGLANHHMAALH